MRQAMDDFFPESNIPDGSNPVDEVPPSDSQTYSLQRVDTGMTSIVGSNNGERPGGFVLVIDGTALRYVSDRLSRRRSRR
jgi:phospholipid-translocating ATPase